jgi:hypothetical protein
MALVTLLPNFYSTSAIANTDINNAASAILSQIGGENYDEGGGGYGIRPGNIDTNNLSASPAFRNSQKAEPNSLLIATAQHAWWAGSPDPSIGYGYFGPYLVDTQVIAVGVINADGTTIPAGCFGVLINGQPATLLDTAQGSTPGSSTASPQAFYVTWWKCDQLLRAGSYMLIDPAPNYYSFWSTAKNSGFTADQLTLALMRAKHVSSSVI